MNRNNHANVHVTLYSHNPPNNIDFYSNDLGPRLVKLMLNQDDVMSHHLYFGDKTVV